MYRTQGYNGHWDKITLIHKNLPKKKKGKGQLQMDMETG
jgi:hypothetical protein